MHRVYSEVFQRYLDPFIVVFIAFLFCLIPLISVLVVHQILPDNAYSSISYLKMFLLGLSTLFIFNFKINYVGSFYQKLVISFFSTLFLLLIYNFEKNAEYLRVFKLSLAYILFFNFGFLLSHKNNDKTFFSLFCLLTGVFLCLIDPFKIQMRTISLMYRSSHYTDYVMWSYSYAVLSLLSLFYNKRLTYPIIIISIVILACLNSRGTLIFYSASALIYFLTEKKYKMIFLVAFLILSLVSYSFFSDNNYFFSRYSALLNGTSSSLNLRYDQIIWGLKDIKENFFFGNFLGQLDAKSPNSGFGHYMHTYLAYWRQFGVVIFALLNAILFSCFKTLKRDKELRPLFIAFLFTSFLAVALKSFNFPELYIWIGLVFGQFAIGSHDT